MRIHGVHDDLPHHEDVEPGNRDFLDERIRRFVGQSSGLQGDQIAHCADHGKDDRGICQPDHLFAEPAEEIAGRQKGKKDGETEWDGAECAEVVEIRVAVKRNRADPDESDPAEHAGKENRPALPAGRGAPAETLDEVPSAEDPGAGQSA